MRTVTRMVWLVVLVLAGVQASWEVMGYCTVKSFGAKGDGVTNDTAAIQKALELVRFGEGAVRHCVPRRECISAGRWWCAATRLEICRGKSSA